MDISQVLAMMMAMAGERNHTERTVYAEAIVAVTESAVERAALTTIAKSENWFHVASYPPFGVTHWVSLHPEVCQRRDHYEGCQRLSIRRAAGIALESLRFIRRVRCPGRPWADVLGRYHHGVGHDRPEQPFAGCYPDPLAMRQVGWIRRYAGRSVR
jgi:hypothetical protein